MFYIFFDLNCFNGFSIITWMFLQKVTYLVLQMYRFITSSLPSKQLFAGRVTEITHLINTIPANFPKESN